MRVASRLDSTSAAAKCAPAQMRELAQFAEHRPETFTKTQAIQRLIVPIRATQAKGYSLAAIGQVLSESGIPITTGALRAYLSEAGGGAGGKKREKGKRVPKGPKEIVSRDPKSSSPATRTQPMESTAKPGVAGPSGAADLDWEPIARLDKAPPPPSGASRAGFNVRPDTKHL
jgi:hypothetical protein